jgi:hypothetical protein
MPAEKSTLLAEGALVILCQSNERRRVREALQAIVRSGNILQRDAAEYLRMV